MDSFGNRRHIARVMNDALRRSARVFLFFVAAAQLSACDTNKILEYRIQKRDEGAVIVGWDVSQGSLGGYTFTLRFSKLANGESGTATATRGTRTPVDCPRTEDSGVVWTAWIVPPGRYALTSIAEDLGSSQKTTVFTESEYYDKNKRDVTKISENSLVFDVEANHATYIGTINFYAKSKTVPAIVFGSYVVTLDIRKEYRFDSNFVRKCASASWLKQTPVVDRKLFDQNSAALSIFEIPYSERPELLTLP